MKLTKSQQLVYDMEKFAGGTISIICGSMLLEGNQDKTKLQKAVNDIYLLNDALRLHIVEAGGVSQEITPFEEKEFEILTFESKEELDRYADDYAKIPINLSGDLCEAKIVILPDRYGVLVKLHHLVGDAWTLALLGNQFNALMNGETPAAYSYELHVAQEEKYLAGKRYQKDRTYFLDQFKKCTEVTWLSEKTCVSYETKRKTFVIEKEKAGEIIDYIRSRGSSAFMLFTAVLATYMNRTRMGAEKFYLGTAILNRNDAKEKNTAGMFVNTSPMLIELDGEKSFAENLSEIERGAFGILRHQKFNYGDVLSEIRKEFGFNEKLYDVMLSYQNATVTAEGVETTWYCCGMQTESLQFHIDDRDNEGIFRIHYDYLVDKFTEKEIERMHQNIETLLFDAIRSEEKPIWKLELLTEEEKHLVLTKFHHQTAPYQAEETIHSLFEKRVEENPDRTAVVAFDATLTYGQLNEQANKIANGLLKKGIQKNNIVAIAVSRKSYLFAAMLGVLKAGAAYMPIDPNYPKDRIDYMIEQAEAVFCITDDNILELLDHTSTKNPGVPMHGDDLYCALHTSGSTGMPKMALLCHRNIRSFLAGNQRFWEGTDTVVSATIVTFDAFIMDSVLSVAMGKTVILATEEEIYNQNSFEQLFSHSENNMFFATPTKLENYITNSESRSFLSRIRSFVVGGEVFGRPLLEMIKADALDSRVFNIYGPTEAAICVTVDELSLDREITIGTPAPNTNIYILDSHGMPVPIGVTGELCIDGGNVGPGYINNPEMTRDRFVPSPYSKGYLYKTGDLAAWREDGRITYIGRNDFQVKIRGLRIELGEIENAICTMESVDQAVVVVRKNTEGRQIICAFYTGEEVDAKAIRMHIGQKLPRYMVPHIFTYLPEMPLTPSGKISRTALPEVDLYSVDLSVEYVAPETEEEKVLAQVVKDILGTEKVGILDNFFDLGGDSLKGIELISGLEAQGYQIDNKTLFECETIKDLAQKMNKKKAAERGSFLEFPNLTGDIPASSAQMRVFTAQSMNPDSTMYNVPYTFEVEAVDVERLEQAVNSILIRHEILRTKFENRDGRIMQIVDDTAVCHVKTLKKKDVLTFIRPFRLDKAPLIRVGVYKNKIMIDMHHIITDGGSMPVFLHELNELYMGRELSDNVVPYKFFAVSQKDHTESEQYWTSVFKDEVPVVELNTDYKQDQKQTFNGNAFYAPMDLNLHRQIHRKCKEWNITPYVFYMAGFNIMLSKFSGGEDIVVGMPMSGRSGQFLNSIGMFVNTVVLRNQPKADKTVKQFLKDVKEASVNALIHQEYPYGDLVKKLNVPSRRNPLFDIMFAYQSEEMTGVIFGDQETELQPIPVTSSKYDMTFNVMPRKNDIVVMVEYCTDLYKESTISRMVESYKYILSQLLDTEKVIGSINPLTEQEREKLFHTFNDTFVEYDKEQNLVHLFEEQVEKNGEENAVFAMDAVLSYEELNEKANRIAHGLMKKGVCPGDIVAFALPRTSNLIAAMFGILKAGAAYLPVDPDYPKDRIEYMVTDSKASYFITEQNIEELLEEDDSSNPGIYVSADTLCYCIYTSGSTGKPKAVAISHRNAHNFVLPNGGDFQRAMANDCDCVFATNAVVFDITVQDILFPLMNGKFVLFADTENLSKVAKLLVHARIGRTALIITPTKLQMYMQSREFCENLYRFSVIMVGAENFPENLYYELRKYTKAKIFNGYGPTETTCGVLYAEIKRSRKITIGKPVANTQIYIVDSKMDITPVGVTGELCIAGDSVGMGYLYRPELTDEKFIPNPFGEGKLYKTGDLAYWQEDGNICYVGRNDFQVKIRGLRIELGEIENAMCTMDSILQAVVDVRKNREGRQIICAFYTGEETEAKEIRQHIGKMLPKYMVPHNFTRIEKMPMTAGGKVNKKALPEVDLYNTDFTVEYVAPESKREKALTQAAAEILNVERVGLLDNFFDLGGDSLKALELISKLDEMGYQIDSKTIFECDTVKELAERMARVEQYQEEVLLEGDIPATDAQMRVYTAQGMANDSSTYNVTFVFRGQNLDPVRLQDAVHHLVERHEILRTRFENKEGTIYQVVDEDAVCQVEALQTEDVNAFVRPFDLSQAPLLRVGYYENIVMVDMHHIITDGSSMPVFIRELNEYYMGRTIKRPTVPYRHFAVQKPNLKDSEKYWLSVYQDEAPVLELNTDFKPGNKQTFNGNGVYDMVSDELQKTIASKCKELNITPYVFYMGAFNIMLSKFSGNEDIVVGMPISGRSTRYLNTIGMFVNTIALRNQPAGTKTVKEFLLEVKENTVRAMEHQDYPFGDLVKKINAPANGRNPLFDVMLAYQSEEMTEVVFGDQKAELLPLPITTSKYDITLSVLPQEDKVVLLAEYCTDLYLEATIKRMVNGFKQVLTEILDINKELKEISVLNETDREQVLHGFNQSERAYEKEKCVHTIFEEQVAKDPDRPALIAPDCNMTYGELNEQANRIAHGLMDLGVKTGDIIAFALPRKSYMISAMFGILKAGAAYLPVDPGYPQDRIDYMLSDSDAKIFITQENIDQFLSHENTKNPEVPMNSNNLCYCIYTSGSTGKPKGTMLRHNGIVNLMTDLSIYGDMSACKRFGFMTTITFDVASQEILTAYLNGYMGVLMPERRETKTDTIIKGIVDNQIDMIYATSTYLDSLTNTEEKANALGSAAKMCILAGEAFQINAHLAKQSGVKFHNQYGPAETHVVTASVIDDLNDIHIGKPIANTQIYILDKYLKPAPIGVTGELYIGGDCVGAGYLKRPELTKERFLDNPFGEGKIYKTGDLAFWRPDGMIAYIGRNDFQVKIRGQRIELGEIENAMCAMGGIAQAVVVVRKNAEGRQIICAFYTGKEMEAKEIRRFIGKKLPKYMVPHIFTFLNSMPLTASGKISRTALPEIDLYNTDMAVEYVAPETEQEKILAQAIKEVLGTEKVGMLDNFFDLGGDSLKGIELISKLEAAGYVTDAKAIFECDTMKELAETMETAQIGDLIYNYDGDIPATEAQMRIYTAQSMNADITSYNVPYIFKVAELDPVRLQKAVDTLVARHEIFRTWFKNAEGQILQIIEEKAECPVEKMESDDLSAFVRPFKMDQAPLLRVGYYDNIVMIDMHHTITDGGSMPVFLHELNELYMGRELSEEPVPYKLFAVQKPDYAKSKEYWLSVFHDEPPVLELNTDYKPGPKQSFKGSAFYEPVMPDLFDQITKKCKELNITPYVYYMTAFNVLLSRFSGSEDIVVGMPMSGRGGRFINTIGMFVNTIALRNQPVGTKTVKEFLNEVKDNSVNAIAHQDYPFGKLVKKLHIGNDVRNPLFDVMFAYQSEETTKIIFGDKEAELLPMPATTSKYDFTFNIMPKEDHAIVMVEYCTDLYKESTMKRFAKSYQHILTQMLEETKILKEISAVPDLEREKLLGEYNDYTVSYPKEECIHELFEKNAQVHPDKTAVIACDKTVTYGELNQMANKVAHSLLERGIGRNTIVAVALNRRTYLYAAMLGILKAGAAYMPIDPNYPQDRIEYMLKESEAALCIVEDNIGELLLNDNTGNPNISVKRTDMYCALHTSGSTGMPKMALLKQEGIRSFLAANQRFFEGIDTVVSATIVTFDAFILDSILAMAQGCQVVLAQEDDIYNQTGFEKLFTYSEHNMFFSTPTKLENYITNSENRKFLKNIKSFVVGGEVFSEQLLQLIKNEVPDSRVFNIYGPTEATICAMVDELELGTEITIGKPVANTQIHILDQHMNLLPIGVTGELCIAGIGVGAGYVNRPDMTAEKFVPNPFGEGLLYKTGDLAYWREDKKITYVGRNDFQVKIRGLRIELGEIENAICGMEGIGQAAVVVRKNSSGRQIICAFYTGEEKETKEIRLHIGKILPKYMVPHVFTYLTEMPLTSNGKIDRKVLPDIDLENITNETEYIPPKTNIQIEICKILEEVLDVKPVGLLDNFFDLGGDSLKAIEFVSKAHNEGIYFNLQNVFDYTNVEELCAFIEKGDENIISFEDVDYTAINEVLKKNNQAEIIERPKRKDMGNILLSGSTGFMGIHVLYSYLEKDSGTAYCLVRGDDIRHSELRLRKLFKHYFGDQFQYTERIQVFCGDLSQDMFGLSKEEYEYLVENVDTVIHTAASVKHYGSYQYFYEANVESTRRMIEFSKQAGARLIHTSTLSVSGVDLLDPLEVMNEETIVYFNEGNLYVGQKLDNVYTRSKFEAEMEVLKAMNEGLEANIMRMGNLTSRYRDGIFQKNHESNAFLQRIKAVLALGVFPDYMAEYYSEFTPIDEAAEAVMTIARHFSMEQTVFHISNVKLIQMKQLGEYFGGLGYSLEPVNGNHFTEALRKTAKQPGREYIFESFINDIDENDQLNYAAWVHPQCMYTAQYLQALGFEWSEIDFDYLRKYIDYFKKIGYLEDKDGK